SYPGLKNLENLKMYISEYYIALLDT
ncbi:hypothetical protein LCGC14_2182310, partial [marine sediment metagenome]